MTLAWLSKAIRSLIRKLRSRIRTAGQVCVGTLMWLADHRFGRVKSSAATDSDRTLDYGPAGAVDFLSIPGGPDIPVPLLNTRGAQRVHFSPRATLTVCRNQLVFSNRLYPSFNQLDRRELLTLAADDQYQVLTFLKTYSLGDIIIALPLLRAFKQMFPKKVVRLASRDKFSPLLIHDPELKFLPIPVLHEINPQGVGELVCNLDANTLEFDHCWSHPFRFLHRTDILYYLFSFPPKQRNYDYTVHLSDADLARGHRILEKLRLQPDEYVIFAWKGSGPTKTLSGHAREGLLRDLAARFRILIVDQSPFHGAFDHPNIEWAHGLELLEVMALFKLSRVACVMDSGLLWFAHAMRKPTVCYLGPTLEEGRLTRHPLYPEKAKSINLRTNTGCPSCCFEVPQRGWCKGKILCMTDLNVGQLSRDTVAAVSAVW